MHALARPVRSPRDRVRQGARRVGRDGERRHPCAQRHARSQECLPDAGGCRARAERVRLPKDVVDLPGADPADRRRDEAEARRGRAVGQHPVGRSGRELGPDPIRGRAPRPRDLPLLLGARAKAKVTGLSCPRPRSRVGLPEPSRSGSGLSMASTRKKAAARSKNTSAAASSAGTLQPSATTQPARKYWLMKTEPDMFSIDKLESMGRSCWDGVRSFQARNHMLAMQAATSCCSTPRAPTLRVWWGCRVVREAYPDTPSSIRRARTTTALEAGGARAGRWSTSSSWRKLPRP